jgi:hypothetical protein
MESTFLNNSKPLKKHRGKPERGQRPSPVLLNYPYSKNYLTILDKTNIKNKHIYVKPF